VSGHHPWSELRRTRPPAHLQHPLGWLEVGTGLRAVVTALELDQGRLVVHATLGAGVSGDVADRPLRLYSGDNRLILERERHPWEGLFKMNSQQMDFTDSFIIPGGDPAPWDDVLHRVRFHREQCRQQAWARRRQRLERELEDS
jgi:hypothetical protein